MAQAKKLLPSNFVIINGIPYFRLENGTVSVENPNHVTINVSVQDDVELVTLNSISKEVNFWKVTDLQDNIYALASCCHIAVPKDITFDKFYFSKSYPEGVYVKYFSAGNCGILYVSETKVSTVISHTEGYSEICFENGLFYAEDNNEENKYYILNESGGFFGVFPSRCKKLNDYLLFYDDNKIFVGSDEYEIPGGITSIEVLNNENIILVKIINNNGVYYYTKNISYLLGPIQKHSIITINEDKCYITETVDTKIINVFYISYKNETYTCESISCDTGIVMHHVFDCDFFSTNDSLYVISDENFLLLFNDIDVDKFSFKARHKNLKIAAKTIIGFKNNIPVLYAEYSYDNKTADLQSLTIIDSDFDNGIHICKKDNKILVIDKDGNVILSSTGEHCYKKQVHITNHLKPRLIYIVEDNGIIYLYKHNGEPLV